MSIFAKTFASRSFHRFDSVQLNITSPSNDVTRFVLTSSVKNHYWMCCSSEIHTESYLFELLTLKLQYTITVAKLQLTHENKIFIIKGCTVFFNMNLYGKKSVLLSGFGT